MKKLYRLAFLFICIVAPAFAWGEDFIIAFNGNNKWVAQSEKQPLLELRSFLIDNNSSRLNAILPSEDRELNLERLYILIETIGRKVPDLVVKEIKAKNGVPQLSNKILLRAL